MGDEYEEHVDYVLGVIEDVEESEDVTIQIDTPEDTDIEQAIANKIDNYANQRVGMSPREGAKKFITNVIKQAGVEEHYRYINENAQSQSPGPMETELHHIGSLQTRGKYVDVEGTVIDVNADINHDDIILKGRIADETGSTPFTLWATDDGEYPVDAEITVGEDYYFTNVNTNLFEARGRIELDLRETSQVEKLDPENAYDIDPDKYRETIQGRVVNFTGTFGLIDRCPNETCRRVLDVPNECEDCGDVDSEVDLRTRAIVDNGTDTWTITLDAEQTGELLNIDLETAQEQAEETSRERVEKYIQSELHGEFLTISGIDDGRSFNVYGVTRSDAATVEHLEDAKKKLQEAK